MDLKKLKACIAYVCAKPDAMAPRLDPVKLNKILWYSDAAAFMRDGRSITGSRYARKPRGPVARYVPAAVDSLEHDGIIRKGKRFDPKTSAWLSEVNVIGSIDTLDLTPDEKKQLDFSYKKVCGQETDTISEQTHGEIWELAAEGEDIPLYAVYAERLGKVTQDHVKAAFGE